jgi:hypothetical protein
MRLSIAEAIGQLPWQITATSLLQDEGCKPIDPAVKLEKNGRAAWQMLRLVIDVFLILPKLSVYPKLIGY